MLVSTPNNSLAAVMRWRESTWECEMMGVASVLECTALRSSSTKRRMMANSSSTCAAANSLWGLHRSQQAGAARVKQ